MNLDLLVFGSKNFNNTIREIKENLQYSLIFFNFDKPLYSISSSIAAVVVDGELCKNKESLSLIEKFNKKPIIFLCNLNIINQNNFDNKILLPISLLELKKKITNIIAASKFTLNSSIKIKDYILNKNEKKLIKLNLSISLTEREVQLIELLFQEKKALSKKLILKKIWNYSSNADTHTVETHIYRLRKKIYNKFKDNKFIANFEKGYLIWKKEIKLQSICSLKNIEKGCLNQKKERVVLREWKLS